MQNCSDEHLCNTCNKDLKDCHPDIYKCRKCMDVKVEVIECDEYEEVSNE